MTEAEWLDSDDPAVMLEWLRGPYRTGVAPQGMPPASDRKLRLFACACALANRGHPNLRLESYLEVLEEDGQKDCWQQSGGASGVASAWCSQVRAPATAALLGDIVGNPFRPVTLPVCGRCDGDGKRRGSDRPFEWTPEVGYPGDCLVCDGVGWDAPYRTPTVLSLARAAYEERDEGGWWCHCGSRPHVIPCQCSDCGGERRADGTLGPLRLLVLADALEESGCDSEDLLRHLRGQEWCWSCQGGEGHRTCDVCNPKRYGWDQHSSWVRLRGPHVRGCWAVDLILGKE